MHLTRRSYKPRSEHTHGRTSTSLRRFGASIPCSLRLAKPQLISLTTLAIIFTVVINHSSPLLPCPLLFSPLLLSYPPPPTPRFIFPPLWYRPRSPLLSGASAFVLGLQRRDNANGANGRDAIKLSGKEVRANYTVNVPNTTLAMNTSGT